MKQSLFRTFFTFSKNQQRGIIALLFILIVSYSFLWLYDPVGEEIFDENIKKQVEEFLAKQEEEKIDSLDKTKSYQNKNSIELKLRNFDPNTESLEGFVSMGFTNKLAKNFINYRTKVRPFSSPEDVSELYVVDNKLYEQLKPYVIIEKLIPSKKIKARSVYVGEKSKEGHFIKALNIDINRTDTSELKKIKGIGSYYARGIINYRNALGGFSNLDQIREAYVFQKRPEAADLLLANVFVDPLAIVRINVNEATLEEFWSHPYLDNRVSNALYNYREQHGTFNDVVDIKRCHLVTDKIYLKIAPYLSLQ